MSLTSTSIQNKHSVQQSLTNNRESVKESLFSSINFTPTLLRNPRSQLEKNPSQQQPDSVQDADLKGDLQKFQKITSFKKESYMPKTVEETEGRDQENTQSCSQSDEGQQGDSISQSGPLEGLCTDDLNLNYQGQNSCIIHVEKNHTVVKSVDIDNSNLPTLGKRTHQQAEEQSAAAPAAAALSAKKRYAKKAEKFNFVDILEKAQKLAKVFGGSVLSSKFSKCKGVDAIRFNCQNEHNFYLTADVIDNVDIDVVRKRYKQSRITLERIHEGSEQASQGNAGEPLVKLDIENSCWCPHCVDYFYNCLEVHNKQVFQLVGGLFTKYVLYRCNEKGHMFHVKSIRKHKYQSQFKIQDYTCPDCTKDEREEERRQQAAEEEERRAEIAAQQRKLFEQIKNEQPQETYNQPPPQDYRWQQEMMKRQEQELISQRSHANSVHFMNFVQSLRGLNCSEQTWHLNKMGIQANSETVESYMCKLDCLKYEQILLINTLLMTSTTSLSEGMLGMSEEGLRSYYKQMAKDIHPDKNVHPKSKEAFQKMKSIVDQCLDRRV